MKKLLFIIFYLLFINTLIYPAFKTDNLVVSGNAIFSGIVTTNILNVKDLYVSGNQNITGNLNITNDLTVNGTSLTAIGAAASFADVDTTLYKLSGVDINQGGALYNVAYLDISNTFSDYIEAPTGNFKAASVNILLVDNYINLKQGQLQNLDASSTIDLINTYALIAGNGTAVTLNSSPQIVTNNIITGTEIEVWGDSDVNTVTLISGNGLKLNSGASFTLGKDDIISFRFNGTLWVERFRSNN